MEETGKAIQAKPAMGRNFSFKVIPPEMTGFLWININSNR